MNRSKALAVVLILALAMAGGLQALSVIPHVHGHDLDHSAHSACPVHQAQNHTLDSAGISAPLPTLFDRRSDAVVPAASVFVYQTFLFQESLRAPPASF